MLRKIAKRCTEAVASIPAQGTMKSTFVVVLVLSALIWCTETTLAEEAAADFAGVTMTSSGYQPALLRIQRGTTVRFVNTSTENFWPAIDHHPTHTLFDGTSLEEHCSLEYHTSFDACGAIEPSEEWSFVFTKSGTFPYHDHFWPHLKGTIIVTDAPQTPESTASLIEKFTTFSRELFALVRNTFFPRYKTEPTPRRLPEDIYARMVPESDPNLAIAALKRDAASSSAVFARCHESLHAIGKEAFYQYGSFGAASVFQNDFCNSGYIHGVFEAYFLTTTDPTAGLVSACNDYAAMTGRSFDLWQCHHGVGHGFMYYTGGDLRQSLALCNETFVDTAVAGDCHNGVYMEVFNDEILALEPQYFDEQDPTTICETASITPGDCYHYLPTFLYNRKALTLPEVFSFCDTIPPAHRDACKLGAGTESMKRSMAYPEEVFPMCGSLASLRDQVICVAGAVSMYVNQTASLETSYALCEHIAPVFQETCREVVDMRKGEFNIRS